VRQLGADHPATLTSRNNLAVADEPSAMASVVILVPRPEVNSAAESAARLEGRSASQAASA
jgi:hypothetical protein